MSYKNYHFETVASDFHSPYIRNWLWTRSFFKYPKLLGISRAVLGTTSREDAIEYITDTSTWAIAHEELKALILKDYHVFGRLIESAIEQGERMNAWTEKNLFEADLGKAEGEELMALLATFVGMQEDEYAYGTALPILDLQDFSFIERNLTEFLKSHVSEEKYQDYYAAFTEPDENSFAQDQEEDLLRLMARFYPDEKWRADVAILPVDALREKYPDFYNSLVEHTRRHAWVYYVYAGPAFTENEFLGFIRDYLKKGIVPGLHLAELAERRLASNETKRRYLEELKPDEFNSFILQMAGRIVWAKPRRKDYQSKSYYHAERLLAEIAHRLSVTIRQVRSMPHDLLAKALRGETADWHIADEIYKYHICLPNDDGTVTTLVGEEAEGFSRTIKRTESAVAGSAPVRELKGTVASRGHARGAAKLINTPEDMSKMEYGDILVSTATTPSVVPAMKKAAAIVTDEGGLTCHAAIVSRELKIPCVVGTKIATQVIKDGDMVEVDAEKGIVRKIEV